MLAISSYPLFSATCAGELPSCKVKVKFRSFPGLQFVLDTSVGHDNRAEKKFQYF